MDRLAWTSCLLILLFCISATSTVYGDELSEGLELMNDEAVKIQGDAAFPAVGDPANLKADITYLVHLSKGVKKSEMEDLVNFLKSLLRHANIDSGAIRVALAFYKQNIRVQFDFSAYSTTAEILDALDLFKESRSRSPKANVATALKSLPRMLLNDKKGDRPDAKNYIVLVTDLEATTKQNIETNAQSLKNDGAEIITVGVGLPDSAELRSIASEPSGLHSFFADDYASLSSVTPNILSMIPPLDDISVSISTVPVPSRPANPRVYTTSDELDLVFAIHLSEKVNDVEIRELTVYIKDLLERVNIAPGKVRVGAVAYTDVGTILFNLREFRNVSLIIEILNNQLSLHKSDSANVASLLETVRTKVFGDPSSDRANVPNALLIITDKNSNMQLDQISSQAELTRNAGNRIFTVGIQLDDKAELETISSKPTDQNVFAVIAYNELPLTKREIVSQLYALRADAPVTTTVAPKGCYNVKADLVFILDTSARVREADFQSMLQFSKHLLDAIDIDSGNVRIGFLTSSKTVKIHFHLRKFKKKVDILRAIDRISYANGATNTAEALKTPRMMFIPRKGARQDVTNIAVLLTDARSSLNSQKTFLQAKRARDKFYKIITVGIGFHGVHELNKISSDGLSFPTQDFRTLETQLTPVAQAICSAVPEATSPTETDRVEVPTHSPEVDTPEPATLPPTEKFTLPPLIEKPITSRIPETPWPTPSECGASKADIVFILDSSTSVSEPNFKKMLLFVKDFIQEADIDSRGVRAGLLIYSTEVKIQFFLNEYRRKIDVLNAVDEVPYVYGSTNTADALKVMRTDMFTRENGDRPSVPNIAIILTDGVSNINAFETIPQAKTARAEGIQIYAIGIGLVDTKELDGISSKPIQKYRYTVREFDELKDLKQKIFAKFCPGRKPAKPSAADVETGQDIILMLDTSVDISLFQWMIAFARAFTGQADVNSGQMRIGLMVFSDEPYVEAELNSYLNQADLLQVVDSLPHKKGKSDKARAFRKVTTQMFTPKNGDRPKAANKIILLTGAKTVDSARVKEEARFAKENAGAEVFVLGLNATNTEELNAIGSLPTDEHVFLFKDPSVVLRETATLLEKIQEEYIPPVPKPTPATTTTRRTKPSKPTPRRTTPRRTTPKPTPRKTTPTTTTTTRRTTTTTTTTTTPRPTPPRVYRPSECTSKSDILFIVDSSGSVGDEDFRKEMDFVYRTIDSLDINSGLYNVGLISFSDQARIEFYLNSYLNKEELENATASVKYVYGSTHTAMAFRVAREAIFTEVNGDRPDAPNLIIMITDGQSNINHEETLPQAQMLKDSGVTILTVAIGFATHTDELIGMTSKPVEENLFYVDRFSELEDLHTKIVEPICKDRNHCDNNPCKNGAECYDTLRDYICICAPGYFGPNCEKTCPQPADIAFVFDSSSSVGINAFNQMKSFVENLLRDLEAEKCDHHIAVMKYSSRPIVEFSLDRYNSQESMIRAINGMSYTKGYANMANAMAALRQRIFNGQNGDRPTVKNIAYLLTDGQVDVAKEETLSQAELAISSGIHIVPIGFDLRNREEVDSIAASQGIKSVEILSASDVGSLSESLLYAVFDSEDRCNPNPCSNGATCINQALGFRCECILGYSGETCEKRCESEADVVFVVDTSRYIPRRLLKQVKRILRKMIKRLSFKSKNMRVGLVAFGSQASIKLYLSKGERKRDVLAAISSLRPGSSNPKPGNALRMANQRLFTSENGDRRDVPNYLILVTKSARDLDSMVIQAHNLKMKGTRIISIALTGTTASTASDLSEIVSLPLEKNKYIIPNNTEDHEIFDIIENLVEIVCYEKACLYSPCHNGGTCLPDDGTYVCQCPPGYAGRHCETACNQDADVIFLLDSSGSVSKDEFRQMKEFVISISEKFSIGFRNTRIGAATYSSNAFLGFNLNSFNSASRLRNALSSLPYIYGNTNIAAGLKLVRSRMLHYKAGDRPHIQNFVIVLTNGQSNINSVMTIPEAEALKKFAHVYTIAIGSFHDAEIKEIASAPAVLNAFTVPDYESLFQITDRIVGTICQTSTPCDDNPCKNGGICVPSITTYTCECILGYSGKSCERRCNPNKDIAFVVDSSSSIGAENFKRILTFVSSLVTDLSHENGNMRYAFITYNDKGTLVFSFGRFLSSKAVSEIIEQTAYKSGSTNIAAGLRNAIDAFSDGYGSRPDADNIAIVITDGYSNVEAHLTVPTADALKAKVKKVIGIGIGLSNTDEIMAIASGENNLFLATDFNSLHNLKTEVLVSTCEGDDKVELEVAEVIPDIEKEPIKIEVA